MLHECGLTEFVPISDEALTLMSSNFHIFLVQTLASKIAQMKKSIGFASGEFEGHCGKQMKCERFLLINLNSHELCATVQNLVERSMVWNRNVSVPKASGQLPKPFHGSCWHIP